jgi:tRNA(fMet)-specific endonuclease VapC
MGRVIDSSLLVAAERGKLDLSSLRSTYSGEVFVIATITASELLEGVHRADGENRRLAREAFVETSPAIGGASSGSRTSRSTSPE